jgi:1,4-alpha-glucan branching enzyme
LIVFSGTTNEKTNNYPMHLQKDGSWIIDLPFSCEGKKYKYLVEKIISTNSPVSFFSEIIDPYAPSHYFKGWTRYCNHSRKEQPKN